MNRHPTSANNSPPPLIADRFLSTLDRFLHIEAVSGIVLLLATAAALIWANSPAAASYQALWHAPIVLGFGDFVFSRSLHFWINDGLMTIFFLVVGLEIRREMHEGALANLRLAALPIIAALGGVVMPAIIYLLVNTDPALRHGWAVPTATDIAFAVGALALLGKAVPANVRILLLALAVIDDIVAVLIIALFYSADFNWMGLGIAASGMALVMLFQGAGIRTAWGFVIPGAIVWLGMLQSGIHPTLAGVILGLMTPVKPWRREIKPIEAAARALNEFGARMTNTSSSLDLGASLRQLRDAQRELLTPVNRVQRALHPWVAYAIMPLFALANAGVVLEELDISHAAAQHVMFGVVGGLILGKPIGVFLASWLSVRLGIAMLPEGVTWRGVLVVGLLAGIGFTMAIFIANLAFAEPEYLGAAKLGILVASGTAAVIGLLVGRILLRPPSLPSMT